MADSQVIQTSPTNNNENDFSIFSQPHFDIKTSKHNANGSQATRLGSISQSDSDNENDFGSAADRQSRQADAIKQHVRV